MRDEENASEGAAVEGREPCFAEPRRQDDESSAMTRLAGLRECLQRGGLDSMGFRRWRLRLIRDDALRQIAKRR